MTKRRIVVLASLAVLAALAVVRWAGGSPPRPQVRVPTETPRPLVPLPTPRPVWLDSAVAIVASEGGEAVIVLVDAGGLEPARRLVTGFEGLESPAWSPDGRTLAFAGRRDGNWDLYRVGGDGTGLQRLTDHPAFDGAPAWSPDGRALAIVSSREGRQAIYQLAADGSGEIRRLSPGDDPALDPAWSPEGDWLAYAAWADGVYRIEAVAPAEDEHRVIAHEAGADLRAPAWSPDGRQLGFLVQRHGQGQLRLSPWSDRAVPAGVATTVASEVTGFAWYPGGGALVLALAERGGRRLEIRSDAVGGPTTLARLPAGPGHLSWARKPLSSTLPIAAVQATPTADPAVRAERPGLVTLAGVKVPGNRIHADLAADYAALREAIYRGVGRDFLGALADGWRPLGFRSSGSAFFSWHKTGRAFDTQMELRGPGGRRDMVLVREDIGGRTFWRMYLRAGAQDGSIGRPLEEPGWVFAADGGASGEEAEGGHRGTVVPAGYWVDFTALAERHGWRRIPSLQGRLDWRRDWVAIEYWHYERRDGLLWFDAARQVYTDEELAEALAPERLRALAINLSRLVRLGFPPGWLGGG